MYKIDHGTATAARETNEAAGTEGYFTEGNPGTGLVATVVTKDFLNGMQDELSAIVDEGGLTNDKSDSGQVLAAIKNICWHPGNDGAGSGLDADLLDGYELTSLNTALTVVGRDGNGYITSEAFKSEFDTTNPAGSIGYIMTQVETTTDTLIRPSTPAQVLEALNIPPGFASGTRMLFSQASAPTGWTQDTSSTADNRMMRVVKTSGGGTGGSASPIVSHNHTTSSHTLTTAQIPSHNHSYVHTYAPASGFDSGFGGSTTTSNTGSAGGGGSHTHGNTGTLSAPKYINIIICSKN